MNDVSIDVDMLDHIPAKTMLAAISKRDETRRNADKIILTIRQFSPLFRTLESLDIDVHTTLDDCCLNIVFAGDTEKFRAVWGALRQAGFKPDTRPDPTQKANHFYTHWRTGDDFCAIWFNFTSSVCKRVQVGTKTVEQPVYEIQCDSIEVPPEIAAPETAMIEEFI